MCIFINVYYIIYDIPIICYLICQKLCIYYYYYPPTIIILLSINHYMFFDRQLSEGPRPKIKISLF